MDQHGTENPKRLDRYRLGAPHFEEDMYNYNISFFWDNGQSRFASTIIKTKEKYVTNYDILKVKNNNDIPKDAVVLAVSYLGEY